MADAFSRTVFLRGLTQLYLVHGELYDRFGSLRFSSGKDEQEEGHNPENSLSADLEVLNLQPFFL